MPGHRRIVSGNVKAHILLLHNENQSVKDICCILGIRKSLVYKTLSLYSKYGTVTNSCRYSHLTRCPRILSSADVNFISSVIQYCNTIYLNELQHELWIKRCKHATISTLLRTLQCLAITRKIVSSSAAERNEETQALYMNHIAAEVPNPNMLVFIDEAAKDK